MDNRIYRSRETKMLAGVCGGIADMYNLDPTLVRLVTAALIFFSAFTFLLVYVMCAIIIPLEPSPGYILQRHKRASEPVYTHPQESTPVSAQASTEKEVNYETPVSNQEPVVSPKQPENASESTDVLSNDETVITTEADRY